MRAATCRARRADGEKILERYFDGEPWVGKESPVSSIDAAVTGAVKHAGH